MRQSLHTVSRRALLPGHCSSAMILIGVGCRLFSLFHSRAVSPPPPQYVSSSAADGGRYAKLEAQWLLHVGPDALTRLRSSMRAENGVLVIAGVQLSGKSTGAQSMANYLGGEVVSGKTDILLVSDRLLEISLSLSSVYSVFVYS